MIQQDLSFILESGYRCFAIFGVERFAGDQESLDSTLVEWLEPSPDEPILIVMAGAQLGPYEVLLRIGDEPRAEQLDGSWEDIAEVSLVSAETLALGDIEDGWGHEVPVPAGVYRLRVSAAGRTESAERERALSDEDLSDQALEPLERYLLELWPAHFASAALIGETSQFAHDQLSPPELDWPAEREPGLEAARRVAADLRGDDGSRSLSGRLGEVLVTMEVDGSPLRIFNRVKHANGWPSGNGGALSLNEEVGDSCSFYGDPPDSDGLAPLLGTVETTVLEFDRPRQFAISWNWQVAGPDGMPYPTNPAALETGLHGGDDLHQNQLKGRRP